MRRAKSQLSSEGTNVEIRSTPIPTKQRAVYEALRAEIMGGQLQPGEVLVIDALAKRFQVSIIPVREALRQLQSERLVEIRAHTGVRVTPVDISAITEIFALLGALETASALQALPRMTEADLRALETILKRLETAAERGDHAAFEQANREFHLLPCHIAGFSRAEEGLQALLAEWERLHRLAFQGTQPPSPEQANKDHRAILRAFRQQDADKLAQVIRKHNETAVTHYLRQVK
ncbi:DNA-binding transcriptional regulator, GntR family [Prosthecobacter debontii]|uniref:DNA-binding transcriptional regulator, GntR family n=1 Tax=Prosthecobacter debontii TaxID=48467 RepID=A0A1T4YNP3_9BACT|nr:GntR family transcriptional regulator [Prosthecobacter debontii]SKB02885.1 DNA-binding transcriptional regulator, GntR family [Prosthecobacter debontii]